MEKIIDRFIMLEENLEDINYCLLRFLITNKEKESITIGSYRKYSNPYNTDELIRREEQIETNANEVPHANGEWSYNGRHTREYSYSIIGDKLLIIEEKQDIEGFDPPYIRFSIYPNAQDAIIKRLKGHQEVPYLIIEYKNGDPISQYYFESPKGNAKEIENETPIMDALKPLSLEELLDRYEEEQKKSSQSETKKQIH